jgi:hypothetical protein
MIRRRVVLSLPLLAPVAGFAAASSSPARVFSQLKIAFSAPHTWSQEDAEDKGAIYFFSPVIEGGNDASMLIELPRPAGGISMESELKALSERNVANYLNYVERRLSSEQTSRGLRYALLEYETTKRRIAVVERVAYIPISKARKLAVFGTTTKRTESENLPVFEQFMQSLVAPQ